MLFIYNFNCGYQSIKMAIPMFTRFINVQSTIKINKFGAVGYSLSVTQHSDVISKSYNTKIINHDADEMFGSDNRNSREQKMNKAVRLYLQRTKEYSQFIEKQIAEYDIGKRHLATMMGEDPDKFTERDIKKSIQYLFPSGLYEKKARPIMEHPIKLFGKRKEAGFDAEGRPFHFLYYTTKPNYYEVLHNAVGFMDYLNKMEDKNVSSSLRDVPDSKLNVITSEWISQVELGEMLNEHVTDKEYKYFITTMEKLLEHPLSKHAESFLMKYRNPLTNTVKQIKIPKLLYDKDDRPYIVDKSAWRKTARGQVKVLGKGSGKITINGKDITYFDDIQCREQVIFPLIFTDMCDKVDVEATVHGGGPSGQAGLIRQGIARALKSFVDLQMVERMNLAGLLSLDVRIRERKKPGQEGARKKFTWKKR